MFDHNFSSVVPFVNEKDKLLQLDLTAGNPQLTPEIYTDTIRFGEWINEQIAESGARYAIGGYNEHRVIYNRSQLFDSAEEPRRLHLGEDIWGPAGTLVMAPLAGIVHSAANNNAFGDYGGTIILQHQLNHYTFYTLYGHLSGASALIAAGRPVSQGEVFAYFGDSDENGGWPPHLHFQIILDVAGYSGDYPGVCRFSEKEKWLANSPDPSLILNFPH